MSKDNILSETIITGANGAVGSYIDFGIKTDSIELDVTDLDKVFSVLEKHEPKVIVHLAAETDLNLCEKDPQHAYLINSIGTYNVAMGAKAVGAKLIYISTSGIFDGQKKEPYQEEDNPNPKTNYGKSKFVGELFVKGILDDYIIARVSWVFGGGPSKDQKFVAKIIKQSGQPEIKVIKDKYGSPTYGKDLVHAIKALILKNEKGIFHLSNMGAPSRVEVAKEVIKILNTSTAIEPVDSSHFGDKHIGEGFNNEGMKSKTDIMRPWNEALQEYIQEEWSDYTNRKA